MKSTTKLVKRLALAFLAVIAAAPVAGAAAGSTPQWSKPFKLTGMRSLAAVSCSKDGFCAAVGGGRVVMYRAGRWGRAHRIDPHGHGLATVSCTSKTFCVAGDRAGNVLIYNGTSWSSPKLVDPQGFVQISCSSRTFCGGVDVSGVGAVLYNGSTWSTPARIPGSSQPLSISCRYGQFCMALDGASTGVWRFQGGRWSAAGTLAASNPQGGSEPNVGSAIACSGQHFCAALDDFGEAFTWTGGKWSRPVRFDPNLLAGSDAVSCALRNACAAVDATGKASMWNGHSWSPARLIDSNGSLSGVSCATARFCVAVDYRGQALMYQAP